MKEVSKLFDNRSEEYKDRTKFAKDTNNAIYFAALQFDDDLPNSIKIAPIVGRIINDDSIGKFIIYIITIVRISEKPSSIIKAYWYIKPD